MSQGNAYGNFYESGNTARKKNYIETPEQRNNVKRRYGKNKKTSHAKETKNDTNKVFVMISIVFVFSMIMLITYRYNIISEKNLISQNLKTDLEAAEANLLTAKIAVDQNTDLDYIEAYAKQKLGMQKPTSSQTIYIDTSNITQVVEVNENLSVIENIGNKLKEAFNSIF